MQSRAARNFDFACLKFKSHCPLLYISRARSAFTSYFYDQKGYKKDLYFFLNRSARHSTSYSPEKKSTPDLYTYSSIILRRHLFPSARQIGTAVSAVKVKVGDRLHFFFVWLVQILVS